MTLTIDIDEVTRERLDREAKVSGKALEEYVADIVKAPRHVDASTKRPNLGFAAGRGIWISDDFDEPLEEFKDYM
ncbi:MAG: type II toxin-antitoxin system prevent-host-death family antitoxin [Capsulimonadaceae bacterium]